MKTAIILAAGRGERLRPLTDTLPKALCLVKEKPLIAHHIIKLAQAGFDRVVINHAHLGSKIRHYLGNGRHWGIEIIYSPEPPGGLETGGGLFHALPLLGTQPFLAVNADIYTDYPFDSRPDESLLAHLVLYPQKTAHRQGDFGLDEDGYVDNTHRPYTFTGIAWYHPALFTSCKIGRYSITPLLRQMITEKKVRGELYQGNWVDIGTSHRLAFANKNG